MATPKCPCCVGRPKDGMRISSETDDEIVIEFIRPPLPKKWRPQLVKGKVLTYKDANGDTVIEIIRETPNPFAVIARRTRDSDPLKITVEDDE